MRVLMTAGLYSLGGFSTVVENLANELGKKGVDVTISALMFKRIPPKGAYNVCKIPIVNVSRLRKFLDYFDIVHNHHPITNYLDLISHQHFIYHYHGAPNLGRGNLFKFSMLSSIKVTKHRFNAIIAVSETGRAELEQYFNLKRVHVIYNGVDTGLFKVGLEERFRNGTPQYLFVGNLYKHKKVEELILALKELTKTYPKAHLQIVGGGHDQAKLKSLVSRLNFQKHASFVGFVPPSKLPYYYSSCDVYVTASRCELFPLPLIEAWACGKPVVASSIPAHAELLSKSKAGILYKTGDLEDLCANMILAYTKSASFKNYAIQFAKTNEWSAVAEKALTIYNELMKT